MTRALFQQAGPAVPVAAPPPHDDAIWCRERSAHQFTTILATPGDRVTCACGALAIEYLAGPGR